MSQPSMVRRLMGRLTPFKITHLRENRKARRQITTRRAVSNAFWAQMEQDQRLRGNLDPAAVKLLVERLDLLDASRPHTNLLTLQPKRTRRYGAIISFLRPRR